MPALPSLITKSRTLSVFIASLALLLALTYLLRDRLLPDPGARLVVVHNVVFSPELAVKFSAYLQQEMAGYTVVPLTPGAVSAPPPSTRPATVIELTDLALLAGAPVAQSWPLAEDGVAIVVNAANPVQELTGRDLADILQRKLSDWKYVGGEDGAIELLLADGGYAELAGVIENLGLPLLRSLSALPHGNSQRLIDLVAQRPSAIGFASWRQAELARTQGKGIKLLSLAAQPPLAADESATQAYSLHRVVGAAVTASTTASLAAIRSLLPSARVRELMTEAGYNPLSTALSGAPSGSGSPSRDPLQ